MTIRIWHQSFTVLENLPAYAEALRKHFAAVARPGTEVVLHGVHADTYKTEYPGNDIRYHALQNLHRTQYLLGGLAAEKQGFDAYAIATIPDVGLSEVRSLIDIPVAAYGESAMLASCMLGRRFGVLLFIEELVPEILENVRSYRLSERCAGARHVGFTFHDVLKAFADPAPIIARFMDAARALVRDGADVIIPGEAPLCVLLARNGISRVEDCPVVDALACVVKTAESMVDMQRLSGLKPSRRGYYLDRPPRERVEELIRFYGLERLVPGNEAK